MAPWKTGSHLQPAPLDANIVDFPRGTRLIQIFCAGGVQTMRRHVVSAMCAVAAIFGSSPAPAEPPPQGVYLRSGPYQQTVKVSASGTPGVFAGSFSVSTRGCIGSVDATGKVEGPGRIVFTKRDETDGTCRITMTFSPDFRSVKVSNDGCLYWHGASCDFEGSLKRVNR